MLKIAGVVKEAYVKALKADDVKVGALKGFEVKVQAFKKS